MKKALISIIAVLLALVMGLCFVSCGKENDETTKTPSRKQPSNNSGYSSAIVKTNKVEIVGETVVHSFYYYGDSTEIVFSYKDGRLDNAVLTRECRDEGTAKTAYDTFLNLNEHASKVMYEDIKLDGLTLTLKYTDFTMQDYKNLSKEELKTYLENESLEP